MDEQGIEFERIITIKYSSRRKYVERNPEVIKAVREIESDPEHKTRYVFLDNKKGQVPGIMKIVWNKKYNAPELVSYRPIAMYVPEKAVKEYKEKKQNETRNDSKNEENA